MSKFYYFGCSNDDTGHYLWTKEDNEKDWDFMKPGAREPLNTSLDTGYAPEEVNQREGLANVHVFSGWTVVSFWDRSKDKRPGSNSAFIAQGVRTFSEVMDLARALFPKTMARFKFQIVPHKHFDHRKEIGNDIKGERPQPDAAAQGGAGPA